MNYNKFTLIIPKINFKKSFSSTSTLSDNIKLHEKSIMPNNEKSVLFILGHSGYGDNAYFNDLFDLNINDIIYLKYYGKVYKYEIVDFEYIEKGKKYSFNFDENNLYLITCDKFNLRKQYVINSRKL